MNFSNSAGTYSHNQQHATALKQTTIDHINTMPVQTRSATKKRRALDDDDLPAAKRVAIHDNADASPQLKKRRAPDDDVLPAAKSVATNSDKDASPELVGNQSTTSKTSTDNSSLPKNKASNIKADSGSRPDTEEVTPVPKRKTFFDLPPELRNNIYRLSSEHNPSRILDSILGESNKTRRTTDAITIILLTPAEIKRELSRSGGVRGGSALLRTCRQIRREAMGIFYSNKLFQIETPKFTCEFWCRLRRFRNFLKERS